MAAGGAVGGAASVPLGANSRARAGSRAGGHGMGVYSGRAAIGSRLELAVAERARHVVEAAVEEGVVLGERLPQQQREPHNNNNKAQHAPRITQREPHTAQHAPHATSRERRRHRHTPHRARGGATRAPRRTS